MKAIVDVAELRKLQNLVIASANNDKMRGETIVRGFQMAHEIYKKTLGNDMYSVDLFHALNKAGKRVEGVIDRNKAKRGGNAIVYSETKPGAFIAVSDAYVEMCLHDIGMFNGTKGVSYGCAHDAVDQLIGVTLLSPERDFEFALDYFMKMASEETKCDRIPHGFGYDAISEVLKLRKALEKEYKLDGSLCRAEKMGFMGTNRGYLEAIANERNDSPLSIIGNVSILATVLLAATMVYLRTVKPTSDDFYNRTYALYSGANHAARQEYHPWDKAVYTHINILNKKGMISGQIGMYVDSLRPRLDDSIKAFLADTTEDTLMRLLTSICFIQQERVTLMTYMNFTNGLEDSDDGFKSRSSKYLMQMYLDAVRLTKSFPNNKPEFELFK